MNKKIGIIVAIVTAVVLVLLGAFSFVYFMTDTFKSNQELFWKYVSNSNQMIQMLSNENEASQKEWKENHSYHAKGDLGISVTKETGTQTVKLGTTEKHSQTTGRTYADITLYNEQAEVVKASYINSDDIYALYCKDIYDPYYIGFRNTNLQEFAEKMGLLDLGIDSFSDVMTQITPEEEKYLLDVYSNIIVNSISQEKYSKTEKNMLTINNQNYEAVGYHLELTNDDIRQIVMNVLNKAKEDEQTLMILSKLLMNMDTGSIQIQIEDMISSLERASTPISNFRLSIYQAGKNITRLQINYNQTAELVIDIDNSKENKEQLVLSVNDTNTESGIEIAIEKQTLSNMIIYTTNIKDENSGYELTMNTSLGNANGDKIENNSKITIFDNDTTIETSYYKTIEATNEEVDIEELTDTSAVIVNNYLQEQLENFFNNIGTKIEKVIPEKIGQLNIRMTDEQDVSYYLQGILSSIVTIANANGVPQPIGITGATAIMAIKSVQENITLDSTLNTTQEQEKDIFNAKFEIYKGDSVNGTVVKTLISTVINNNESNADNEERIVTIKINGNKVKKPDGWNEAGEKNKEKLSQLSNNIQRGNQYTIAIEYDQKGMTNMIMIMEN